MPCGAPYLPVRNLKRKAWFPTEAGREAQGDQAERERDRAEQGRQQAEQERQQAQREATRLEAEIRRLQARMEGRMRPPSKAERLHSRCPVPARP